jgi:hypothetical protein
VIDEEAGADPRARVDLNAGQESTEVRDEPAEGLQPMIPQPVRDAVNVQGVDPRVAQEDFDRAPGSRVSTQGGPDVLSDASEHAMLAT